ncbi:MAG: adenosylcobinamide-phosphate synthase CbiB [Thauera sp.]
MLLSLPLVLALKMAAGLLADRVFGEVRRFHPLVGFGRWAGWVERVCRTLPGRDRTAGGRLSGVLAWALAVLPWVAVAIWLRGVHPQAHWVVDIGLLYLALGGRSLAEHAQAIAAPLAAGNLDEARRRVGWIVSRDTSALDEEGVARAATESVLENGNDAVFGALFWFLLAGGAGALLFRLANTLDAMWGYRTPRFLHFGWAAARIDDVLNFAPARLTALTYALLGRTRRALACWRAQAPAWDSPNAGPVMAAGAGALGVRLGGAAIYHGREEMRPPLGEGRGPDVASIRGAVSLVRHGSWLWLAMTVAAGALVLLAGPGAGHA